MFEGPTLYVEAESWIQDTLMTENTKLRAELEKKDALLQRQLPTVCEEYEDGSDMAGNDELVKKLLQQNRVLSKRVAFFQEEKAQAVAEAEAAQARAEEAEKKLGQQPKHVYASWMQMSIHIEAGHYTVLHSKKELYYVF